MQKGVVLLHGIFRTDKSMRKMEKYLQSHGYQILNIHYPSTRLSIEEIVDFIHPQIDAFQKYLGTPISFVGYSMGGLVIRAYVHKYNPPINRVVMLGTPNQGSEVADFVKNWRLYKKLYGPAGQQLITLQEEFKAIFGSVTYDLGIIAGNLTIDPISSLIIGWPNDGKVSVASTKLEGMKDHMTLRVPHTLFPISKKVHLYVARFLELGHF